MSNRIGRLPARRDFLRVAKGRRVASQGLVLQAAPVPEADAGTAGLGRRVGFTATKKIGNAVIRNRARRRLRAAAASVMTAHAAPGHDYVLIARDGTGGRPWRDLLADLESAMRRLGIWRDAV
jgi:ribonuclease P protein component